MPMNAITQARGGELHSVLWARYQQLDQRCRAKSPPVDLGITQGLRTWNQQDELWAKGRTTPGAPCKHGGVARPVSTCDQHPLGLPVTKAKGGWSAHNFGYALDAAPDDPNFPGWQPDWHAEDAQWEALLAAALDCGLAEGAAWRTFPDAPHLYLPELPATPDDNM